MKFFNRIPTGVLLVAVVTFVASVIYAAEMTFSDHRPSSGDTALSTAQKSLALTTCRYSHIAGAATTTIKSGAGALHTLNINTKGTTSTATIYDNTAASGTVIAIVDTAGAASGTSMFYDVAFSTGLTIVTTGTLSDITVGYR